MHASVCRRWPRCSALALAFAFAALPGFAQPKSDAASTAAAAHDGQRDFDFEIGCWHTHVSRLAHPLSGATTWLEYDGTSAIRALWDGAANQVDLDVMGPAGRIQGTSLRLYNPDTHQWSLNFASRAGGVMTAPSIGGFAHGRGVFYGDDTFGGRPIRVRFVIFDITPTSARFEQAFSADGGKTWEANWKATDTRIEGDPPDHCAKTSS